MLSIKHILFLFRTEHESQLQLGEKAYLCLLCNDNAAAEPVVFDEFYHFEIHLRKGGFAPKLVDFLKDGLQALRMRNLIV